MKKGTVSGIGYALCVVLSLSRIIAADLEIGTKDETSQFGSYLVVCRLIGYERVGEIAKQLGFKPDETNEKIVHAVFNDFLTNFWKQGTPVTVQWIITPDGKGFKLSHMSSNAWEGMEFSDILTIIYS